MAMICQSPAPVGRGLPSLDRWVTTCCYGLCAVQISAMQTMEGGGGSPWVQARQAWPYRRWARTWRPGQGEMSNTQKRLDIKVHRPPESVSAAA
jgi:hypothetical protein